MRFPKSRRSYIAYVFWYFQTLARVVLVDAAAGIVRRRRATRKARPLGRKG